MYKVVGGIDLKPAHLISFDKLNVLDNFKLPMSSFRSISNPAEHRAAVHLAIKNMEKSGSVGTALAMLARASNKLEIVCWPGVPGEFLCVEEAIKVGRVLTAPTIMWDPYATFSYFGQTGHVNSQLSGTIAAKAILFGKTNKKKSSLKFQTAVMPAWVVLAHEIGHFYHYTNRTSWFTTCLNNSEIAAIEAENLKDHEQPILKDIGKPVRVNYQDFKGGSNDGKHITWPVGAGNPSECARPSITVNQSMAVFNHELTQAQTKKNAIDNAKRYKPAARKKIDTSKFANLP